MGRGSWPARHRAGTQPESEPGPGFPAQTAVAGTPGSFVCKSFPPVASSDSVKCAGGGSAGRPGFLLWLQGNPLCGRRDGAEPVLPGSHLSRSRENNAPQRRPHPTWERLPTSDGQKARGDGSAGVAALGGMWPAPPPNAKAQPNRLRDTRSQVSPKCPAGCLEYEKHRLEPHPLLHRGHFPHGPPKSRHVHPALGLPDAGHPNGP